MRIMHYDSLTSLPLPHTPPLPVTWTLYTRHSYSFLHTFDEAALCSQVEVDMVLTADGDRTYENRVSFDTFDNKDTNNLSFSLRSKHKDYTYDRTSRTFLCGTDQNDYSEFALDWLLDELVDDGDEVVCLRVVDKDSKISSSDEARYRTEAGRILAHYQAKRKEKDQKISLILEFAAGKVQETIQHMVKLLKR